MALNGNVSGLLTPLCYLAGKQFTVRFPDGGFGGSEFFEGSRGSLLAVY